MMVDMIERPEFVEGLLDRILYEWNLPIIEQQLAIGVDGFYFAEDWGSETSLLFSPKLWRRFIKPRLAIMYERCQNAGVVVGQHSDGAVGGLFPDLIEIGLQVFNPLSPTIMERSFMKRSEINEIMRNADAFIRERGFYLPPFAYWSPAEWTAKGDEVREIVECELGWDITDFGRGDYRHYGLFLFTLRNGKPENLATMQGKLYAEKIMIVDVDQITPMHFHWSKTEDIINRGGGKLVVQLYNSTADGGLADTAVVVSVDGVRRTVKAGDTVVLGPGESITLPGYLYHKFWGAEGRVLVGEVSLVNDDNADNRFYEPIGRFPEIEEDEPPLYLLTKDYPRYYLGGRV